MPNRRFAVAVLQYGFPCYPVEGCRRWGTQWRRRTGTLRKHLQALRAVAREALGVAEPHAMEEASAK